MRPLIIVFFALCTAMLPAAALAQDEPNEPDDFNLRVNGDYIVPPGETIGTLVVIRGDVRVEGRVDNTLVVIDGDARVTGSVGENIVMVRGDLTLASGSTVNDVSVTRGDLIREPGSTVTGSVDERSRFFSRGAAIAFGIFLWLGLTVALIIGGVVFAAVGREQLMGAAALMTDRPGPTILSAVITVIVLPILAVVSFVTIVGIPAAIGVLLFVIPALAFLGYLVAAAMLGRLILGGAKDQPKTVNAFAAVLLGILILQVVLAIPFLGFISVLIGLWGTGALVFYAFRAARSRPRAEEPPAPPPTAPPEPAS